MKYKSFLLAALLAICSCVPNSQMNFTPQGKVKIHDIQGCGHVSPFSGRTVKDIVGIVTWKLENGFFMQDSMTDDQNCTSEGIYVRTKNYPEVIPGDRVSVNGKVSEFIPGSADDYNLSVTEIIASKIETISENNPMPDPVVIGEGDRLPPDKVIEDDGMREFDIKNDGLDFFESLEGMRVQINNAVVVESTNSYGEVFVIPDELVSANEISGQGALIQTANDDNPERILVVTPDSYHKEIDMGDRFTTPIVGVVDYQYGNYRVLETNQPDVTKKTKSKIDIPDAADDNILRIATYNINNFNRFDEQKLKTIASQVSHELGLPDILVLEEVQDDSGLNDDGVTSAAKNLNVLTGKIYDESEIMYHYLDPQVNNNSTGGAAGGNIRTVMLYRTDRGLEFDGMQSGWVNINVPAFSNSRRPLVARFTFNGKPFYLLGIHLVSNNLNTPLYGSVQPPEKPEEGKRASQAQWIVDAVNTIKSKEPETPIIVAGDFNDTPWSKTLTVLGSSGLVNLSDKITPSERYSFIFEGNATMFDQFLTSKDLMNNTILISSIHVNTADPEKQQVSDHDPVLIDIRL